MSGDTLALIAGAVLSLLFSYVPGLNSFWEALDGTFKRLAMLVLIFLVAGAAFGLACSGWGADLGVAVSCDKAGFVGLAKAFILAMVANQGAYKITKG